MVQHDAAQATLTRARRFPSRTWAIVELLLAIAILFAGVEGYLWFTPVPFMLGTAALFLWRRGPGWRAIGLRQPDRWSRAVTIGGVLSLYQFASLYLVEPLLARLTGELPDVTMFASVVGDELQLLFWLAISWTVAAFMEELVFRGWLTARLAESIGPVHAAWIAAVVLSSVLFGLSHIYQGLSGVLATGISGLLFGAAYLATGRNLWGAILAHGLTDTIGFVMIYLGIYPGLS